jgi:hypothetical protein
MRMLREVARTSKRKARLTCATAPEIWPHEPARGERPRGEAGHELGEGRRDHRPEERGALRRDRDELG